MSQCLPVYILAVTTFLFNWEVLPIKKVLFEYNINDVIMNMNQLHSCSFQF